MSDSSRTDRGRRTLVRGFTLTELLVAVVVLLVIILAVGRIFGTASQVVKNGEATADILQETAAISQLMRRDLDRISDQGFLVIQCIAVRNDVMILNGGGLLLDPTLPTDHVFRCDQIAFLADDLAISRQIQTMGEFEEKDPDSQGYVDYLGETLPTPQSTQSVLYYGHGVQFPYFPQNLPYAIDPLWVDNGGFVVQPWFRPSPGTNRIDAQRWPGEQSVQGAFNGTQPLARNWTLARQETLLADDYDAAADHFMSRRTGTRIFRNAATRPFGDEMRSGRVDVLSGDIGRIRSYFAFEGPQGVADGLFQFRPRAEKRPPTLDKSDVLLTTNVLGGNCSSFIVDWTWSDGVGRDLGLDVEASSVLPSLQGAMRGVSHAGGTRLNVGYETGSGGTTSEGAGPQPWFGMGIGNANPDVTRAGDWIGASPPDDSASFYGKLVRFHAPIAYDDGYLGGNDIFGGTTPSGSTLPGSTLEPQVLPLIEGVSFDNPVNGVVRYRAVFGLNGKEPFVRDGRGEVVTTAALEDEPSVGSGRSWPLYRDDYTPWPSAIRVTATFHDPKGVIEDGRTIQFVIPLPDRVQDLPE